MQFLNAIKNIFDAPFFSIWGGISTIIGLWIAIRSIFLIIKGSFPVWYRLGRGLSGRKIAVFAEVQKHNELKTLLIDSNLFLEKNIIRIDRDNLKKASDCTLLLIHYDSFKDKIDEIIANKRDVAALIIYAPSSEGLIGNNEIEKINNERNSIVVNMRGRLINDILTCMITTGYEKK